MRHPDNVDRKLKKNYIEKKQSISFEYGSNAERMDPKAYSRFKSMNTNYSSKRECQYGEKDKKCDPGCIFWMTCRHGWQEKEWKGDEKSAQSNTESKNDICQ